MKKMISMLDKPIQLEITPSAEQALGKLESTLYIEMELYFSCLLRKRVVVRNSANSQYQVKLTDHMMIVFHPVMTRSCSISSCEGESPPLSDFPIQKPECYIPHWLKIDYKNGEWTGDFGYFNERVASLVKTF